MKIPGFISIGGLDFRVILREMSDCGQMLFDRREILISSALSNQDAIDTLRHEMLHAALYISGHSFGEKYEEEPIVRALENIFFPAWQKLTTNEL